jgi:hypothetical protein
MENDREKKMTITEVRDLLVEHIAGCNLEYHRDCPEFSGVLKTLGDDNWALRIRALQGVYREDWELK